MRALEAQAHELYNQGRTRNEVAAQVFGGNYNSAHSAYLRWKRTQSAAPQTPTFRFDFDRTFGVEIEAFGVTMQNLKNALEREGLNVEISSRGHACPDAWKITRDGSVQGNDGFELVSPVLKGQDGLQALEKACRALKSCNAKINKTCGLHVHLGADDLKLKDFRNLIANYARLETQIDAFMPESRRECNNRYIQSLNAGRTLDKTLALIKAGRNLKAIQKSAFGQNRYFKLNTQAFWVHKTVEFRHHSGTIEFDKIAKWVLFTARLTEYSKKIGAAESLQNFTDPELDAYIADRKRKLSA